ncbi:MAG: DUF547 domain-containing protein [Bacteroidia bacterium]|nr:DUF547 domain-containing protein [Bacteroidia bacterium]
MKRFAWIALALPVVLLTWFTCSNCRAIRNTAGSSQPVSHEIWDALLKRHVDADGFVDYPGMIRDSAELNRYLAVLESAHPNDRNWSREAQMAYWINAYNAYTVQLIIRHYPVASIKDIKRGLPFVNTVWDVPFIRIESYTYDLNNIEHNILRPVFQDARVHAAINCASYSCPKLRAEAFVAERLDAQLDDAMRTFVNDPLRNRISAERAEISEIFKWFSGDFQRDAGSVRAFVSRYAAAPPAEGVELAYLDYDWRLNGQQPR